MKFMFGVVSYIQLLRSLIECATFYPPEKLKGQNNFTFRRIENVILLPTVYFGSYWVVTQGNILQISLDVNPVAFPIFTIGGPSPYLM